MSCNIIYVEKRKGGKPRPWMSARLPAYFIVLFPNLIPKVLCVMSQRVNICGMSFLVVRLQGVFFSLSL